MPLKVLEYLGSVFHKVGQFLIIRYEMIYLDFGDNLYLCEIHYGGRRDPFSSVTTSFNENGWSYNLSIILSVDLHNYCTEES